LGTIVFVGVVCVKCFFGFFRQPRRVGGPGVFLLVLGFLLERIDHFGEDVSVGEEGVVH
jgi:hypothetical protein